MKWNKRKGFPVTGNRAYRQYKRYLELANLPKSRTLYGMRHRRVPHGLKAVIIVLKHNLWRAIHL